MDLAKLDLEAVLTNPAVPIHPSNYETTGLKVTLSDISAPTYRYDARLPFGVSKRPKIFQGLNRSLPYS